MKHCKTCRYFSEKLPVGKMPGVTMDHRRCTLPSYLNAQRGWRHPTDSCADWAAKKADNPNEPYILT